MSTLSIIVIVAVVWIVFSALLLISLCMVSSRANERELYREARLAYRRGLLPGIEKPAEEKTAQPVPSKPVVKEPLY
jgi:hypothetical protein